MPRVSSTQAERSWLTVMEARKAVAIHWASMRPMPKAPITWGTATLTMVAESTTVMAAIITVTVAIQR